MKNIAIIVVFCILCTPLFAQDISLTQKHVGIINTVTYDERLKSTNDVNLRISSQVIVNHDSLTNVFLRCVFTYPGIGFGQFWIEEKHKDLTFKAGLMPRPISLNRPSPVGHEAQFEPKGTTVIPGGGTGLLLVQKIKEIVSVSGGVYYLPSEKIPEYNAGVQTKVSNLSVMAAGFYSKKKHGIGFTIQYEPVKITGFWDSEKTLSGFSKFTIGEYGDAFCTFIYDRIAHHAQHFQIGLAKDYFVNVESLDFRCLFGCGYVTTNKVLNIYIWMYF